MSEAEFGDCEYGYDDDWDIDSVCPRCHGVGKITTLDYESYFGAQYKPCPQCYGDDCLGEPPLS